MSVFGPGDFFHPFVSRYRGGLNSCDRHVGATMVGVAGFVFWEIEKHTQRKGTQAEMNVYTLYIDICL